MVICLVDDLGHGGVQSNNPHVLGPKVQALQDAGVYLSRSYVYKYCSPTRGSLLSGRYPFRLGNTRSNFIPWSVRDGLQLGFDTVRRHAAPQRCCAGAGARAARADTPRSLQLPLRLKRYKYANHHVGKWHLGFYNSSFLPVNRGFDSFFGYLTGETDHFTETVGTGFLKGCGASTVDLTSDATPARGRNGSYSGTMYGEEAVAVIKAHAAKQQQHQAQHQTQEETQEQAQTPLFLNFWLQSTHGPFEVPAKYKNLYKFEDAKLNTFNGMVSVVDEAVGNVTAALKVRTIIRIPPAAMNSLSNLFCSPFSASLVLKATGLWSNTWVVYTQDNGAPLGGGGSNFPFRGGKNSNFEVLAGHCHLSRP